MAKFSVAFRWSSFSYSLRFCDPRMYVFSLEELSFSDVVITIFHKLFWNFFRKQLKDCKMGCGHHLFVWIMVWKMHQFVMAWWKQEVKVEGVSLVPPQEIRELKDFGEKFSGVCVIFSITCFYAMEDTGLLHVDNVTNILALHLIFLPKINLKLPGYMEAFF